MPTLYLATITPNKAPMKAVEVSSYLDYFKSYPPQRVAAATSDADKKHKKQHTIIGAIGGKMKPGMVRSNDAMEGRDLLALDFDHVKYEGEFLKRLELMGSRGVGFVAYKTFSYTLAEPRFRVLVPLDRLANESEWRACMVAVARSLGEELDPAALTWSQVFLMPAETLLNMADLVRVHDGAELPVDKLLTRAEDNQRTSVYKPQHGGLGYSGTKPMPRQGQPWMGAVMEWLAGGAGEGQRNTWMTQAIGYLVAGGVAGPALRAWVEMVNNEFVTPPLPEDELNTILYHVVSAELQKRKRGAALARR